jgi:Asp/Glu/hydantoin racemase
MKPRFLFIQAFDLPLGSPYLHREYEGGKEAQLMNHASLKELLADVDWELDRGPVAAYGDWPVESREEYCIVGAGRLPIVRKACESGKYDAIVLLGGGDPGFQESREIARPYNVPVTACAHSQMHVASMLGQRFSVIEMGENLAMYYRDLIRLYGFEGRCASIRNINYKLARPNRTDSIDIRTEKAKGESSEMFMAALEQSINAVEQDGAEVLIFGCSCNYWMQPLLQKRLEDIGWEVPVLEGYSSAIALAKTLLTLKRTSSGITFPSDRPRKVRSRIPL